MVGMRYLSFVVRSMQRVRMTCIQGCALPRTVLGAFQLRCDSHKPARCYTHSGNDHLLLENVLADLAVARS